jgi:hypothetical protein
MAKPTTVATPTFRQLPLPFLGLQPESTPPLPPAARPLSPEHVWTELSLTMQLQVRSTILRIMREVLNERARQ